MSESNSIETIDRTNLTEQTDKISISEISKFENYFHEEINQRKSYNKRLSKHANAFDYIDKVLIVLSVSSGGVSNFSSTSAVGASIGIAGASFTLTFSLTAEIIKKITKHN